MMARCFKRLAVVFIVIGLAGCGLNPPAERTPDGFDPPFNYY